MFKNKQTFLGNFFGGIYASVMSHTQLGPLGAAQRVAQGQRLAALCFRVTTDKGSDALKVTGGDMKRRVYFQW